MAPRRIVIAGAGGFLGRYLARRFAEDGDTVLTIGRSGADATWGDTGALTAVIDGAQVLINLAGRSVNCRYNERNRAVIFSSRLLTTGELGRAVESAKHPPPVWFNASTATIYRHADNGPMTDEDGQIGSGFSVNVATAWEREFFAHEREGVRQVALRMAVVLGPGSALTPLLALARIGLGGPQVGGHSRRGSQRFSWIHREDLYRAIRFIEDRGEVSGPVNVAAPTPVTNAELMATIRRILGVRFSFPTRRWMLEIGALVLRTETELLLKSRWVLPSRLQREGFVFEHPLIEGALREITGRVPEGDPPSDSGVSPIPGEAARI